jgi:hypothetical protein
MPGTHVLLDEAAMRQNKIGSRVKLHYLLNPGQ